MRIDWSTYKNHAGRLANLIGTYEKQRKALDNPMYSAEYKQEQAANLRAGVRAAVGETLAAIREQIGKDAEAARYRAPEVPIEQQAAHFAERTYWATVLPQELGALGPDGILWQYGRVTKDGTAAHKGEFERVAERLLEAKGSMVHKARYAELRRAAMTTEEKQAEQVQAMAATLDFWFGWLEHQTRTTLEIAENGGTADTGLLAGWADTVRQKAEQTTGADQGGAA